MPPKLVFRDCNYILTAIARQIFCASLMQYCNSLSCRTVRLLRCLQAYYLGCPGWTCWMATHCARPIPMTSTDVFSAVYNVHCSGSAAPFDDAVENYWVGVIPSEVGCCGSAFFSARCIRRFLLKMTRCSELLGQP